MSHGIKMLLCCLIPLGLIFLLPLLGAGGGVTLFLAVTLMFACHMLMIAGFGGNHHDH